MRKVLSCIITALILLSVTIGLGVGVRAAGDYIEDGAGLLTQEEIASVNSAIESVREKVGADIIIVTADDGSVEDTDAALRYEAERVCADYTADGGGYGDDHETILLYINMANRAYFINEYNASENFILSDSEIDSIGEAVSEYLADGDYSGAAETFVSKVRKATQPGFFSHFYSWILVGLLGGGAASGIAKGAHNPNTKTPKKHYRKGEAEVKDKTDQFTGSRVERRKIERKDDDTNSGAGSEGNHGGGGHF